MSSNVLANVLDALIELQETLSSGVSSFSRPYMRREHIPLVETRFRLFDEYHNKKGSYERIGSRSEHLRTHAGPFWPACVHRLMIYSRFVTQPISFRAYALDVGMEKTTVSNILKEVSEAIMFVLHNQAFPPLMREEFEDVAGKTQERFDYPRAVGFMDGKHKNIKKPARSVAYSGIISIIIL